MPQLIHPGAFVSSGGTSEKIALVVGRVDVSLCRRHPWQRERGRGHPHVVANREEFIARARRGEITDFKTLLAAYWLAEHRRARKEVKWLMTDPS